MKEESPLDAAADETARRLQVAQEIAWDAFDSPSDATVTAIFTELCAAESRARYQAAEEAEALSERVEYAFPAWPTVH
jgi:hypothetical protein